MIRALLALMFLLGFSAPAQAAQVSDSLLRAPVEFTPEAPVAKLSLADGFGFKARGRESPTEVGKLEKRIEAGNTAGHVGILMMVGGGVTLGVGVVLVLPGAIIAIFGDPTLLIAGLVVGGIGLGTAVLGGLTAATGAIVSTPPLNQLGVKVPWTGMIVAGAGLGVLVGSLVASGLLQAPGLGSIAAVGAIAIPVGLVWQTVETTSGYRRYKKDKKKTGKKAMVTPVVAPDHRGVALVGRF